MLAASIGLGYFLLVRGDFKLGLDLAGGTELIYEADTGDVSPEDVGSSMQALRDVIERRVNLFGVSEPVVQVETSSLVSGSEMHRLVVELPGVTDINEAVRLIGETPTLEFKLLTADVATTTGTTTIGSVFTETGLTGKYLERARLEFTGGLVQGIANEPVVALEFNSEGQELFAEITRNNIGSILAIFLDGEPISMPVIREEIITGTAQISGGFTPDEARELVKNLNFGALPIPIELVSTQSIGPTLGEETVQSGILAGIWSFALISIFLIFWYRLPGVIASVTLAIYAVLNLALFLFIPVTLTAAGIAGFILSVGIAVDSNILVFERIKEEVRNGKSIRDAVETGFSRAWTSIRDANITGLISGVVLFWLGTSIVKGFALTLSIGILTSMLTAVVIARTFLLAISSEKISRFFYLTGFNK